MIEKLIEEIARAVDGTVEITYDPTKAEPWTVDVGSAKTWGRDLERVLLHMATMGWRS